MTPKQIDRLEAGSTLWDKDSRDSVTGLHVRAFPTKKVFYLFYRTKQMRQRRPKLGLYPTLSLTEAREVARAIMVQVAAGKDPSAALQAERAEVCFDELFIVVKDEHWSKDRFAKSGWKREAERHYEKLISPTFGKLKPSQVSAAMVRDWHQQLSDRPYLANRSLEVFSRLFSFMEEKEWRPQNSNPCKVVKAHPEMKRKRVATDEEISRVAKVLAAFLPRYQKQATFLYTMLYSGTRPRLLERATWADLSTRYFEGETWGVILCKGKSAHLTGEPDEVLLPPFVLQLIEKLPRSIGDDRIFGIKMPRLIWSKIRTEAGCPDLWARDMRRTFASVGKNSGLSMDQIAGVLNHRSVQTTTRYALSSDQSKFETVSKVARVISEIAGCPAY